MSGDMYSSTGRKGPSRSARVRGMRPVAVKRARARGAAIIAALERENARLKSRILDLERASMDNVLHWPEARRRRKREPLAS
jgi:hypothetical protein